MSEPDPITQALREAPSRKAELTRAFVEGQQRALEAEDEEAEREERAVARERLHRRWRSREFD